MQEGPLAADHFGRAADGTSRVGSCTHDRKTRQVRADCLASASVATLLHLLKFWPKRARWPSRALWTAKAKAAIVRWTGHDADRAQDAAWRRRLRVDRGAGQRPHPRHRRRRRDGPPAGNHALRRGERQHAEAYALAQEDQARLRSMRLSALNNLNEPESVTVGGDEFTVESPGRLRQQHERQPSSCSSGETSADYVRLPQP